ncbi:hypothetical protein PDIG_08150 [Penicillium digitatum PHI26]|uniref:Uncharacterized protein n=2 Tax=Penicillium digitatum TaxID=36651 RepID=K9GZZ1_PEND2|nr:hypothetical protein PDIP_36170 [Penicillium digitatum Pd1]EKV16284.1 hypothetical protein PDIP_36170 [Penicillium digitatum Pd1]EKV18501.1 hypothetical protein PDIG_08150 [Penicillium digitatum PHI26]
MNSKRLSNETEKSDARVAWWLGISKPSKRG